MDPIDNAPVYDPATVQRLLRAADGPEFDSGKLPVPLGCPRGITFWDPGWSLERLWDALRFDGVFRPGYGRIPHVTGNFMEKTASPGYRSVRWWIPASPTGMDRWQFISRIHSSEWPANARVTMMAAVIGVLQSRTPKPLTKQQCYTLQHERDNPRISFRNLVKDVLKPTQTDPPRFYMTADQVTYEKQEAAVLACRTPEGLYFADTDRENLHTDGYTGIALLVR